MKTKAITSLLVLLLFLTVPQARAELFAFCALAADPPAVPFTTLIHAFTWDAEDEEYWNGRTRTSITTPPNVVIVNNPREDAYFAPQIAGDEFIHFVSPAPPPGAYTINGFNTMQKITGGFPQIVITPHPQSPSECISLEFIQ